MTIFCEVEFWEIKSEHYEFLCEEFCIGKCENLQQKISENIKIIRFCTGEFLFTENAKLWNFGCENYEILDRSIFGRKMQKLQNFGWGIF